MDKILKKINPSLYILFQNISISLDLIPINYYIWVIFLKPIIEKNASVSKVSAKYYILNCNIFNLQYYLKRKFNKESRAS